MRLCAIAFLVLVITFAPERARATTVEPLDDSALVQRSDLIARVMVTSARAERVGRRIITLYDLDIVDVWHARDRVPPRHTTLALPGGIIDVGGPGGARSLGQVVPGTPVLEVGRAYVLCLGDDVGPQRARGLVGLWLGAFEVLDSGGLRAFVHGGARPTRDPIELRLRLGTAP
jgi:hypothetical protein